MVVPDEKNFKLTLNKIGELYEKGKDHLNSMSLTTHEDIENMQALHEVLQQLRNYAATGLKSVHTTVDN